MFKSFAFACEGGDGAECHEKAKNASCWEKRLAQVNYYFGVEDEPKIHVARSFPYWWIYIHPCTNLSVQWLLLFREDGGAYFCSAQFVCSMTFTISGTEKLISALLTDLNLSLHDRLGWFLSCVKYDHFSPNQSSLAENVSLVEQSTATEKQDWIRTL